MALDTTFHPLTWPDVAFWRKQRRSLLLTFIGLPLLVSIALWGAYVGPILSGYVTISFKDLSTAIATNLWAMQIILGLWLGMVCTIRATAAIAHLRETSVWPLVKIMPYSLPELFRYKTQALQHGLRWPIRLVLILRVASLLFGFITTPPVSLFECMLTAVFLCLFCAELFISVRYNCAVGLLASTLARTTAQANGFAYLLHGALFLVFFAPLWWGFWQGSVSGFGVNSPAAGAVLVQYGLLSVMQLLIIGVCYSVAIRRAERLVD